MKLSKLIKREIGITIATVLLVTTVFIMFSYAIFKVEVSGDTDVITFGDIDMSFCTNTECDSTLENVSNVIGTKTEGGVTKYVPVYPQKDPVTEAEWNELTPYTFSLKNTGDLDLYISLYLVKDTTATIEHEIDGKYEEEKDISKYTASIVDDNQIKVAIGEKNSTPTIRLFSEYTTIDTTNGQSREIAKNILIPAGESKIFNLYAWLREDAENASQGKLFVSQIFAKGEYLPEADGTTPTTEVDPTTETIPTIE